MTGSYDSSSKFKRTFTWDEEGRLLKTVDNKHTTDYRYDANGERICKYSDLGETIYASGYYTETDGKKISKHIYIGSTRVASQVMSRSCETSTTMKRENTLYYHTDHLGSSGYVTDKKGEFYEHTEYTSSGESWVNEKVTGNANLPFKYTGKEMDSETGLYYYGARYYDARTSRWISTDPPLSRGDYFPTGNKEKDKNLPGMGGVFNSVNLNVYHYAGNNPVKYVDPDGNDFMPVVFPRGAEGWGHAAGILIEKNNKGTIGKAILYEQGNWGNTKEKNKEKIRKKEFKAKLVFDESGEPTLASMKALLKELHEYRKQIGTDDIEVAYVKTTSEQDKKIKEFSESRYNMPLDKRKDYNKMTNNCIDFVKDQGEAGDVSSPLSPFPKSSIKTYQKDNTGYNYNYKTDTVNKIK